MKQEKQRKTRKKKKKGVSSRFNEWRACSAAYIYIYIYILNIPFGRGDFRDSFCSGELQTIVVQIAVVKDMQEDCAHHSANF